MKYCKDLNLTELWVDDGLNPCFIDTVTSGVLLLHMLVCGCIQCSLYRKYATKLPEKNLPGSCGFTLQVMLTLVLMLEAVIHVILLDTSIRDQSQGKGVRTLQSVAGYQLFTALSVLYCWMASIRLLFYERRRMLPSIPTRGHGLILLVFWSLVFIKENLAFLSWWSGSYWWSLKGYSDHLEFGLWIVRYSCSAALLLLGFLAPGLNRNLYHLLSDVETGPTPEVAVNQSTWKNVLGKLKLMIPYVWPKGSYWRQVVVLICLLILGAGRGINVLVPLYSKYIINSFTDQPSKVGDDLAELKVTGPEFRYDYILIYCLLIFLKGGGTGTTGFLNSARTFLWIPVQQYTTRRIQVRLFSHLHRLSLRWHLQRKTGEVLRVMDRGTNRINSLLSKSRVRIESLLSSSSGKLTIPGTTSKTTASDSKNVDLKLEGVSKVWGEEVFLETGTRTEDSLDSASMEKQRELEKKRELAAALFSGFSSGNMVEDEEVELCDPWAEEVPLTLKSTSTDWRALNAEESCKEEKPDDTTTTNITLIDLSEPEKSSENLVLGDTAVELNKGVNKLNIGMEENSRGVEDVTGDDKQDLSQQYEQLHYPVTHMYQGKTEFHSREPPPLCCEDFSEDAITLLENRPLSGSYDVMGDDGSFSDIHESLGSHSHLNLDTSQIKVEERDDGSLCMKAEQCEDKEDRLRSDEHQVDSLYSQYNTLSDSEESEQENFT